MGEIQNANTNYNPDKRSQEQSIYNVAKPTQSFAEQLVSAQLLANATVDAQNKKPPIPNLGRTVNRFGYRNEPPTVEDIFNADTMFAAKFGDWSGSEGAYGGTAYPSIPSTYLG